MIPTTLYPYNRSEECSWSPEDVARHLSSFLLGLSRGRGNPPIPLLSQGLSTAQVVQIRQRLGINSITQDDLIQCIDDHRRSLLWKFRRCFQSVIRPIVDSLLGQLKEPLILMLLGSAAISIVLGNTSDALSIAAALLIVSCVAAIQEYRSERALERLTHLVPHTCTVVRDQGTIYTHLRATELVVGDFLLVQTGDRIPADCRIVDSIELALDESALTGEPDAVRKTSAAILTTSSPPSLTEQRNILFAGTLVNGGRGRAIVIATGTHTEFGKIATELSSIATRKSPLQIKIDELSQRLAYASTAAIVIIAVLGALMGRPLLETLTVAVSLAVAAIPEGLPICVTVTLALGVLRMAQQNAIVKKLPVVESLGCTTVIASDKTGTLTQNESMCAIVDVSILICCISIFLLISLSAVTVRALFTLAYPTTRFGFTGVGYNVHSGQLIYVPDQALDAMSMAANPRPVSDDAVKAVLAPLLYAGCLCNNAAFASEVDASTAPSSGPLGTALSGQPTELALLVAAEKAGYSDPRPQYHRLQEMPFSSDRKRMDVRARPVNGRHVCTFFQNAVRHATDASLDGSLYFVKGMPEIVLGECTTFCTSNGSDMKLDEEGRTMALFQSRRMASSGLRVIALAYGAVLGQLTFAGFVGMEDPPRDGVADAVRQLRQGGVKCLMITGDAKETALAIAKRCGILGGLPRQPIEGVPEISPESSSSGLHDLLLRTLPSSDALDEESLIDVEFGSSGEAMSGSEIDEISAENFSACVNGIRVFYRVSPRHKLTIVRARTFCKCDNFL
jgi:P-type Ca2+ transporter type 2C